MTWWSKGWWRDVTRIVVQYPSVQAAYVAVFTGHASPEQCAIVLADMAREADFFSTAEGVPADRHVFIAGKRHLFTHVLGRLRWTPQQTQQIANLKSERDKDE